MKKYIQQISQLESAADKREFTRGVMGGDSVNPTSFAAGVVAGWLLTSAIKDMPKKPHK